MATPYDDFRNCRILWERQAAPTSLRDGIRPAVTSIVLEGYLVETGPAADRVIESSGGVRPVAAVALAGVPVKGNITRWALLPDGDTWQEPGTSWTWNTTGLRPDGLAAAQEELAIYRGNLALLATPPPGTVGTLVLSRVGSIYGDGGVGAIMREEAGDEFAGILRLPR